MSHNICLVVAVVLFLVDALYPRNPRVPTTLTCIGLAFLAGAFLTLK